jgi:hypothetical protein
VTGAVLATPVVRAIQDNKVSPGVLGFLVVAALGVATWLLIRSMTRQLHKIDFKEDAIDVERQRSSVPEADVAVEADVAADAGSAETDADASPGVADGDDTPR